MIHGNHFRTGNNSLMCCFCIFRGIFGRHHFFFMLQFFFLSINHSSTDCKLCTFLPENISLQTFIWHHWFIHSHSIGYMADEKQNKKLFMKPPFVIITHRNSFSRTLRTCWCCRQILYSNNRSWSCKKFFFCSTQPQNIFVRSSFLFKLLTNQHFCKTFFWIINGILISF